MAGATCRLWSAEGGLGLEAAARDAPFPVYAFVTSCSGFWPMVSGGMRAVVDGDYYLIGRFASGAGGRRFHAGGARRHGGGLLYEEWHF